MHRAATLVTVLLLATASMAWAAYSTLPLDDLTRPVPGAQDEVIYIEVAPEDLGRCIATLMQVTQMPVDAEHVSSVSNHMQNGPTARCVAK